MVHTETRLQEVIATARNVADAFRHPMLILDEELNVRSANQAFYQAFRATAWETENQPFALLAEGRWDIPDLVKHLSDALSKRGEFDAIEVTADFGHAGRRTLLVNGRTLCRCADHAPLLVLAIEDVTTRIALETEIAHSQARDRKIALALQRPMLFQPKEDAFSGLTVRTAYTMASDEALVGGDFWDTFAYDHGHVAAVLGDVIGHGLTSAIFTTELKHTMRAYIREHEQPARVLHHMNRFLYQSNRLFHEGINTEGSDAPVCLALAVFARETGAGTLAIAGMEPPILVRASGETEQVVAIGAPMGILANEEYIQIEFKLEAGDTFVLTTDGITEARRGREFLEVEGLIRLAVAGNGGTLKEMADTILQGAQDFAGGKLRDDASLVLVRRSSTSPHIAKKKLDP